MGKQVVGKRRYRVRLKQVSPNLSIFFSSSQRRLDRRHDPAARKSQEKFTGKRAGTGKLFGRRKKSSERAGRKIVDALRGRSAIQKEPKRDNEPLFSNQIFHCRFGYSSSLYRIIPVYKVLRVTIFFHLYLLCCLLPFEILKTKQILGTAGSRFAKESLCNQNLRRASYEFVNQWKRWKVGKRIIDQTLTKTQAVTRRIVVLPLSRTRSFESSRNFMSLSFAITLESNALGFRKNTPVTRE